MNEINSCSEAKEKGLKKYFTGKPCKRGHVSERYTSNNICIECAPIGRKKHRKTEKYKKTRRVRYEKNCKNNLIKNIYQRAKNRARIKGVDFNITLNDVENVYPKNGKCPIFGWKLKPKIGTNSAAKNSPSLDRINCNLGYVVGNVAVISFRANQIKGNSTISELRNVLSWMIYTRGHNI